MRGTLSINDSRGGGGGGGSQVTRIKKAVFVRIPLKGLLHSGELSWFLLGYNEQLILNRRELQDSASINFTSLQSKHSRTNGTKSNEIGVFAFGPREKWGESNCSRPTFRAALECELDFVLLERSLRPETRLLFAG